MFSLSKKFDVTSFFARNALFLLFIIQRFVNTTPDKTEILFQINRNMFIECLPNPVTLYNAMKHIVCVVGRCVFCFGKYQWQEVYYVHIYTYNIHLQRVSLDTPREDIRFPHIETLCSCYVLLWRIFECTHRISNMISVCDTTLHSE